MRNFLLLLLMCAVNFIYSQSNYSNGFQSGYKNGYCHNQGIGCISPIPPVTPIPSVNESINSFQDGYNQGFTVGLNANKAGVNVDRKRFQATAPTFVEDNMSKINMNDLAKVAGVLRQAKAKALELAQEGKYQESVDICKAGLKINPQDDEFMMFIGDIYARFIVNDAEAIYYLEKAYKINKLTSIKNKINRIKNGTEERVDIENDKIPSKENSIDKQELKNLIIDINKSFKAKNYIKALELSNNLNSINPGIGANAFIGYSNYYLKDYANAIKYFSLVISEEKRPDVYFWRAVSKSELNDNYGAISDLDVLINLGESKGNYDMATVYNNKAYALVGLKNYKEALTNVNKALSLDSSIWYIWDTRGEINYHLNLFSESISDMEKAIGLKPDGNSYYFSGLAKIKLKQIANACKDFSKAGELGKSEAYVEINTYCK